MSWTRAVIGSALATVLLLFMACGDDDVTGPGDWLTEMNFPLVVANQWTYLEVYEEEPSAPDTSYVTTIVRGTREFDGLIYYCMIDSAHAGGLDPDTTYVRQEGRAGYIRPELPSQPPADPVEAWFHEVLTESVPWKVFDARVSPGTSWSEYDTTRIFVVGDHDVGVSIRMTVERLADTTVTVPAGSWTAYRAAMNQSTVVAGPFEVAESSIDQVLFMVDDIGMVMQEIRIRSDFPADPDSSKETAALVEYSL
jgi:hypothetical protein